MGAWTTAWCALALITLTTVKPGASRPDDNFALAAAVDDASDAERGAGDR